MNSQNKRNKNQNKYSYSSLVNGFFLKINQQTMAKNRCREKKCCAKTVQNDDKNRLIT